MTEKERQNREELLKLIRENPDLPIVPMVEYDVVSEDYGYWTGAWGSAYIDEYVVVERGIFSKRVLFKSDDDVFGTLEQYMSDYEFDCLPESEKECRPYYDNLPWIKAIVVYINAPEQEEQA